ncbi:MAG: tetratricopeptide repeat protein [Acidobacteria bacterium]|nr:tetratricopeptide repeat protein [Acidobacteriota bacterium]
MDAILKVLCLALGLLSTDLPAGAQQDQTAPSAPSAIPDDSPSTSARETEISSSKDTRIDLTPPRDDAAKHPQSGAAVVDAEEAVSDAQEFHPWDPHKALKDIEVGDFYYKRKNYRAALERYKDALTFKPNDAVANFRLAECQEKTGNPQEAITHYQAYLKLLPQGPFAADAQKALERLRTAGQRE